ncbi:hypothetical protein ASG41_07985 [Modestobacter sp. Leaf380]|nr:hypothetical protein ASG41_07985 [Modestobacter sp. Leaf380]
MPRAEVLDLFQDADVVLYTGGTSLVEHYPLEEKFAHIEVALTARRPLVLGTQSLGPFQRPAHQEQVRRVTARASAVLLRDDRSLGNLGQIGADVSRAKVLPDIVFALADPRPQRPVTQRPRVAVSARAWNHFSGTSAAAGQASYVDALRGAVTWLVRERQAEVVFLSTCQGIDEYWIDDSHTASMIAAGLPEDVRQGVTVERGHRSPAELQDAYASFDVVLATRMHAAILSLNAGTPVVAVAYEFKTTELFRGLGLEELSHDIETVSAAGLTASLDHVLSHQGAVREVVAGKVVAWRREARELGLLVVSARRKRADS